MQTLFRNLRLSVYISVLAVLAVVASTIQFVATPARAADDNPNDYVSALAQARTLGVGISPDDKTYNDAIGVGAATQERHKDTPDGQELKDGPNLLTFGDHEVIDLGDIGGQPGIPIPLLKTETTPGLLSLGSYSGVQGSVGVAESRVSTVNQYNAKAGAGLLNDDGSLNLNFNDQAGGYEPVQIDVTALLKQLQLAGLTDNLIDQVAVTAGIGGSNAEIRVNEKTGLQELSSNYAVADTKLVVSAPVLEGVTTFLTAEDSGLLAGLEKALTGVLGTLLSEKNPLASLKLTLPDRALSDFLTEPILNDEFEYEWEEEGVTHKEIVPEGIVSVDLDAGTITADLEKLHAGVGNDGVDGINGLPANTKLLSDREVNLILGAVTRLLAPTNADGTAQSGSLLAKIDKLLIDVLEEASIELNLLGNSQFSTIRIKAVIGALVAGECAKLIPNKDRCDISLIGIPLGFVIGGLLFPVTELLKTILENGLGNILGQVVNPLVEEVLQPLISALQPVLNGVNHVATITVNRQWTKPAGDGENFAAGTLHGSPTYNGEAFSVAALEIGLLNWKSDQSNSALAVTLAESTVRAQPLPPGTSRCIAIENGQIADPKMVLEFPNIPGSMGEPLEYSRKVDYRGVEVTNPVSVTGTGDTRETSFTLPELPAGGWPLFDGTPASNVTVSRKVESGEILPITTTVFARDFPLHQTLAVDGVEYGSTFVFGDDGTQTMTLAPKQADGASPVQAKYMQLDLQSVKNFVSFAIGDKGYSKNFQAIVDALDVLEAAGDDAIAGAEQNLVAVLQKYGDQLPVQRLVGLDAPQAQAQFQKRLADELMARMTDDEKKEGEWDSLLYSLLTDASVNSDTGEIAIDGLAVGDAAIVPVLQVAEDCGVSAAAARFDVISEVGELPLTGSDGVQKFAVLAALVALASMLFAWRFGTGTRSMRKEN